MKNIFFLFLLILTSCVKNNKTILISGNVNNLPDGTLYVYQNIYSDKIDSVETKNGLFKLQHKFSKNTEPVYLGIYHIDKKGIKRFIDFPTKAKFRGSNWNTPLFISDSIISISGNLKEWDTKDLKLYNNTKLATIAKIYGGKQTEAYYNIDGDLFDKIDHKTIQTVKEKINKYPYSYHLLYQISDHKNSFSPQQVDEYLKLFKGDITESESYKKLSVYNQKRFSVKNNDLPLLEDSTGKKSEILDPKYKKHLVVFWASWCGPCKEEIPLLKKNYINKNESLEFISVSIDSDKNAWKKALNEEKMVWKQFIVNDKDPNYEKIQMQFKLNGAIPYTVLMDNNFKILKSSVGLSSEKDLKLFLKN
ncbi:hypothetical protein ASG22_17110 [Chryseobacterium sp. Leaf405]|uniref:TlpA disulfide reductase family protein n=1 Tax=Chryseobacterium sp. Leaf405 TaxID=1736367 RepID=UPI0007015B05|nr:TlpA disulfide reductase family protein [Chryseobacterium sp. Leaf405]KQT20693.1 hypothetical protein ASG22_17110 [Chryseobacterium sp. Leaf405]